MYCPRGKKVHVSLLHHVFLSQWQKLSVDDRRPFLSFPTSESSASDWRYRSQGEALTRVGKGTKRTPPSFEDDSGSDPFFAWIIEHGNPVAWLGGLSARLSPSSPGARTSLPAPHYLLRLIDFRIAFIDKYFPYVTLSWETVGSSDG